MHHSIKILRKISILVSESKQTNKMSTTSQKHRNFVAEPMNEKPVTDLAGIGEVLGKRLQSKGFDKVNTLSNIIVIFT